MMKQIMVRAWEIAREGVAKFGGKVKEYFAEALKMAWAQVKEENTVKSFEYPLATNKNGLWIAKITGTHPNFKLDRTFLNEDRIENYEKVYVLYDGVYDVKFSGKGRELIKITKGQLEVISYQEAVDYAKSIA